MLSFAVINICFPNIQDFKHFIVQHVYLNHIIIVF